MTEEQRKAASERMKAINAARKLERESKKEPVKEPVEASTVDVEPKAEEIGAEQSVTDLQAQIREMKENMDLMRQLLMQKQGAQGTNGVQMTQQGELVGEFEKYIVDPSNYPDPCPRLADEPRLQPLAFKYNYELTYDVGVSAYQTKSGKNIREPKFFVTLNRVVLDEQGNPTTKRYIARKLIFHEDPQAALVIARDNNLPVDKTDEKLFLNEMRYYRVRDWLFDIFWPKAAQAENKITQEVIGGTVVQVFHKNSQEAGDLPFDQLSGKVRA